ncbi:MAG: hypothetical protein WC708_17215 [Lentisphaeria bacterium]
MKSLLRILLHLVLSMALWFACGAMVWTLCILPWDLDAGTVVWPGLLGFAAGVLFFTLASKMLVLYVFGHELTHWFVAKLFLRETGDVRVATTGGSVAVQKPNIWISLAPYFIPFYALLWLGCYGIFRFGYGPPTPMVLRLVSTGIGLTYAFHVVLTVHSLLREQSDLRQHGYLLSLSLILFFNLLLVGAGLLTVSHQWQAGGEVLMGRAQVEGHGVSSAASWSWDTFRHGCQRLVEWW